MRLFISFFIVILFFSCAKKESYREYTIKESGGNQFGKSAITEDRLISSMRINYLLRDGITWTPAANWNQGETARFRLASFLTSDFLDISLVHFPGLAGSLRSNIRRWAGQINALFSDPEVSDYLETLQVKKNKNELPYLLIDLKSINPDLVLKENIVVGIFLFQDEILFVKITGGEKNIEAEMTAFLAFIDSIDLQRT